MAERMDGGPVFRPVKGMKGPRGMAHIPMTEDELAELDAVAKSHSLSRADFCRQALRFALDHIVS